jgi:hypothetical protein
MKKAIIGALVGAILVFGWQAVSHMFLHHHDGAYKQVANQENVIQTLSGIFKEDGQYLIPRSNPGASQEETARFEEGMQGKPWAMVTYHAAEKSDMGMAAARSYTTAFLSVLIFILLMGKNHGNFLSIFFKSFGIAFFVFLFVYYNSNIWLQTPWEVIRPELIDLLVAWGLAGIWLGWWLNRVRERR